MLFFSYVMFKIVAWILLPLKFDDNTCKCIAIVVVSSVCKQFIYEHDIYYSVSYITLPSVDLYQSFFVNS